MRINFVGSAISTVSHEKTIHSMADATELVAQLPDVEIPDNAKRSFPCNVNLKSCGNGNASRSNRPLLVPPHPYR